MLSAGMLDLLLTSLIKNAPNIKTIRIGTKIFSYLPQRISEDKELLNVFQKYANKIDLRIMHHLQHPKEITSEMKESVKITKKLGIGHYSQTVMLRGVSDNPKILKQLFQEMDSIGIVPYYVFEKMPQKGTAHLSVSTEEGFNIFKEATYGIEGTAQTAKYVIPNQIGKLHIIDIYEKEGKKFAKARYLKVERNYKGPIEFEMKL
jgi:L-lysine 2,3-aminomutase